jgi:hypothetical protein
MTMHEKIKLLESAQTVAAFWGESVSSLLGMSALANKEKKEEWNKIAKEVEAFYEAPIEERIAMMGFQSEEVVKE